MSFEQRYLQVVSGEARGALASAGRVALLGLEVPYRTATGLRNRLFDRGLKKSIHLDRPTVSIGNLTVGGTGKTPFTAWLAGKLREASFPPAVLMRGYKAAPGQAGDEQRLLQELLGEDVPVAADPDRSKAAGGVLAERPDVRVFLLDDGFQHRRVRREVDLVLVDATRPFGFGHVLPRGLLREPVAGLRRASAVVITRASLVTADVLDAIRREIGRHFRGPVLQCDFATTSLRDANGSVIGAEVARGASVVAACGIGNPGPFLRNLRDLGLVPAAEHTYADHHDFTREDARRLAASVDKQRAAALVVTAKDWVKLREVWQATGVPPVWVPVQETRLSAADEATLLELVLSQITRPDGRQGGPASAPDPAHRG